MNGKIPRVSIGMPVYNGEKYLAEAIEAILAQTYPNFELIISDNASIDNTETICRMYMEKDARILYHRSPRNLGAAENYNRLVHMARGEFFKWAAHDDICAPEFLERCLAVLDARSEVVLCYVKTTLIDADGEIIENYPDPFHMQLPRPSQRFQDVSCRYGLINPIAGVMCTSILRDTGLIGRYAASDRVLLSELVLRGKGYEVDENLFFRRIHPQKSTEAQNTDKAMAAWFDPVRAKKKKVLLPRWQRMWGYVRAVNHAPISLAERGRCYRILAKSYITFKRFGGIKKELKQLVKFSN